MPSLYESMHLSRAAALALVGWLLLIPHYGLDGRLLDSAPLSAWKVYDHYDSLKTCEATRQQMIKIAHEFINQQERRAVLGQGVSQAATLLASRCIATDDPRLAK
jgi:hypothetical protein